MNLLYFSNLCFCAASNDPTAPFHFLILLLLLIILLLLLIPCSYSCYSSYHRFDSPGHRGKHCTYYVINLNTDLVVGIYVAMKRQVQGGSGAMEPAAARCILESLEEALSAFVSV